MPFIKKTISNCGHNPFRKYERITIQYLNDFFKSENLRLYSGFGLRFISKKIYNATFRIDYSFQIFQRPGQSNGGLVFGIGQYF